MNDRNGIIRPDTAWYSTNRAKIPPESLIPLAGQCLAWSADGTRIVAHGADFDAVWEQLHAAGLNPSEHVFEDLPPLELGTCP
jgi:hypothetical protein